ncbi:hypothetical protein PPYR_09276 [Photinus pyralis]|uniref:Uncharacterized protein n=1 Tax=Photinus pyralis TaxID=7054 RepID=A0A1Y1L1V0_PHOPY|nr:hypothetical protein PPYR_09276 [Photinus pyralis]
MIDSQNKRCHHKHIEDVIDARKKLSNFDTYENPPKRRPLSAPVASISKKSSYCLLHDTTNWSNEADLEPSDSEVTIIRIKKRGLRNRTLENKWNLKDQAIPGDGTHFARSPSLINLVTLVRRGCGNANESCTQEYMVPLSSWEPYAFDESDCESLAGLGYTAFKF